VGEDDFSTCVRATTVRPVVIVVIFWRRQIFSRHSRGARDRSSRYPDVRDVSFSVRAGRTRAARRAERVRSVFGYCDRPDTNRVTAKNAREQLGRPAAVFNRARPGFQLSDVREIDFKATRDLLCARDTHAPYTPRRDREGSVFCCCVFVRLYSDRRHAIAKVTFKLLAGGNNNRMEPGRASCNFIFRLLSAHDIHDVPREHSRRQRFYCFVNDVFSKPFLTISPRATFIIAGGIIYVRNS